MLILIDVVTFDTHKKRTILSVPHFSRSLLYYKYSRSIIVIVRKIRKTNFQNICTLGQNRCTKSCFEQFKKSNPFLIQNLSTFSKCVGLIYGHNLKIGVIGGNNQTTTRTSTITVNKSNGNRFQDWGSTTFERKGIFLTPFLSDVTQH